MKMNYATFSLSVFWLSSLPWCRAGLRGSTSEPLKDMFGTNAVSHPTGSFAPLECNVNLDQDPCVTTWSSLIGGKAKFKFHQTVVIPCGKCILMDAHDNELHLYAGLDIQGKLVVPEGTTLKMTTTFIVVRGELHLESSKPINGKPDIQINWIDAAKKDSIKFHPTNNTEACGGAHSNCDLGKRPFVVAGGKVNIRGLPSTEMPTWVPLIDVVASTSGWEVPASEYIQYHAPPADCPSNGVLLDHDFTTVAPTAFGATYGSSSEWTDHSLKISQRRHMEHGPIVDFKEVHHCLHADTVYIVTARVLLQNTTGQSGGLTECAKSGKNCIQVRNKYRSSHSTERSLTYWSEHQSHATSYGKEIKISIAVTFTKELLRDTNVYHMLQIRGPGAGIDIELLEFTMILPPREAFQDPDHVCRNLVPANGGAELFALSPFPFRTNNDNTRLIVAEEDGNRYFQVTGREFAFRSRKLVKEHDWNDVGINWSIPSTCIKAKSTYRIHVDVRVHSKEPVVMEWNMLGHDVHRKPIYAALVTCPPSEGEWVSCDAFFTVPDELSRRGVYYEVVVETLGSSTASYDVDNLSFELAEGPVDRLVLPKSIKHNWVAGAELLLTSHNTNWAARQFVKISRVEDFGEHVLVQLSRSIERPITSRENPDYATEVALLSRNIVLGDGGHFTVLHTSGVQQTIQGADFVGFGEEGVRDRYPIHLDSCEDGSGTIISKNTIRHSKQRCVVLHATNNVVVEGNVAYETAGHCFVLESGTETGNTFENNLGVYTMKANTTMPQMGVSGKETDDTPATFWITNPSNRYKGNVAAGSQSHGFWMQLRKKPRGPHATDYIGSPSEMALELFEGNAVHSAKAQAVKVTGYHPTGEQPMERFRSFLNEKGPFDISVSENLSLINSIVDNPMARSPTLALRNVNVVELRGCHNATAALGNEDIIYASTRSNDDHLGSAPSASSVFNLEDSTS